MIHEARQGLPPSLSSPAQCLQQARSIRTYRDIGISKTTVHNFDIKDSFFILI